MDWCAGCWLKQHPSPKATIPVGIGKYMRLSMTKHHGVAKVAIAHKLAVRLYWMLRSGNDYRQVMERGSHAGQSVFPTGRCERPKG